MSTAPSRGRRLLIVDDDPAIGALIARVGSEAGFEPTVLTDPEEFLEAFDRLGPDVVTIDILMPEVDGIELVDRLVRRRTDVHIVIVSGSDPLYAEIAEHMAIAKGVPRVDCLSKPIDIRALRESLSGS